MQGMADSARLGPAPENVCPTLRVSPHIVRPTAISGQRLFSEILQNNLYVRYRTDRVETLAYPPLVIYDLGRPYLRCRESAQRK